MSNLTPGKYFLGPQFKDVGSEENLAFFNVKFLCKSGGCKMYNYMFLYFIKERKQIQMNAFFSYVFKRVKREHE